MEVQSNSSIIGEIKLENGSIQIENFMEKHYLMVEEIEKTIQAMMKSENQLERHEVIQYLKEVLICYPKAFGVYVVFEPNEYDNLDEEFVDEEYHDQTGRFIPYVTRFGVEATHSYESIDVYQLPKKTLKPYISNPYKYETTNGETDMFSIVIPIIVDNSFAGVVGCDIDLQSASKIMKNLETYNGKGSMNLIDSDGNYITHSWDSSLVGKNIKEDTDDADQRIKKLQSGENDFWFEGMQGCLTHPIKINEHMRPWQIQSKVHLKYVFANIITAVEWILFIIIFVVIGTVLLLRYGINKILTPLVVLKNTSLKIAEGDLTEKIDITSNDEIGQLASSYSKMAINLRAFIGEIQIGSENIAAASNQLNSVSQSLSSNTNQQAGIAEEISGNMEEMTASVQQTNANAQDIENNAKKIMLHVDHLNEGASNATMMQQEIYDKVNLINEIASQIKILALNAAIEAAKAGDHGKGFAVVAREVQKLSNSTSSASKIITEKTKISLETSKRAIEVVHTITPMMQNLTENIQKIALNADEQAAGIIQVSNGTQQLNQSTQANASESEELASSGEEMANQAEKLKEITQRYKID